MLFYDTFSRFLVFFPLHFPYLCRFPEFYAIFPYFKLQNSWGSFSRFYFMSKWLFCDFISVSNIDDRSQRYQTLFLVNNEPSPVVHCKVNGASLG